MTFYGYFQKRRDLAIQMYNLASNEEYKAIWKERALYYDKILNSFTTKAEAELEVK